MPCNYKTLAFCSFVFLRKLKLALSSTKITLICTALLEKTVVGVRLILDFVPYRRRTVAWICVQEHFRMKHLTNLNNDCKKRARLLNNLVITMPLKWLYVHQS